MGTFEWIITGASIFISLAGTACAIIIPILFMVGFGFFFYKRSQQSSVYLQAAQTWPGTTGTVLTSTVQSYRSGRSHSIRPVVVYQYEVNGRAYQSQTIKAGDQFISVRVMGQAQETANRYPAGSSVTVYYNPANPAESALER